MYPINTSKRREDERKKEQKPPRRYEITCDVAVAFAVTNSNPHAPSNNPLAGLSEHHQPPTSQLTHSLTHP
jgi:hypothetical protein